MKQVLAFVAVLWLIGIVAAYGHRALDMPAQASENHYTVLIPEGASFRDVAGLLAQKGLIVSPFWFRVLGKIQDAERKIKPGEYDLHTAMRPPEILAILVSGRVIHYSVLIQEGLTAHQIGRVLEDAHIAKQADIDRLVMDKVFIKTLGVEAKTLEGYLFPDTYHFPRRSKPEDVVRAMVSRLQQVYTPELKVEAAARKMTESEVLTLASIIEKETSQDAERAVVSAVFHNRLDKGILLQSDPTVIYGIPNFDGNLKRAHLIQKTPFNTYVNLGLPPGPIANPGLKSILAALHPAPVKYLYFVSKNDGTHQFSATLAEHNRAVEKYQKQRRSARQSAKRAA